MLTTQKPIDRSRILNLNACRNEFPNFANMDGRGGKLEVVNIHNEQCGKFAMNIASWPTTNWFETLFPKRSVGVTFPARTTVWMSIKGEPEGAHRVVVAVNPRLGPLVFGETDPGWVSFKSSLGICSHSVRLLAGKTGLAGQIVNELAGRH